MKFPCDNLAGSAQSNRLRLEFIERPVAPPALPPATWKRQQELDDAIVLKAAIEALTRSLAACYNNLPPQAQASVIELEKHLAAVRQKI